MPRILAFPGGPMIQIEFTDKGPAIVETSQIQPVT